MLEVAFLLDTHILIWWENNAPQLPTRHRDALKQAEAESDVVAVSIISLWEIARLVARSRLQLAFSVQEWFDDLKDDPLIEILPLTTSIILESIRLQADELTDPADQLIVATARVHGKRLMTVDGLICNARVVPVL